MNMIKSSSHIKGCVIFMMIMMMLLSYLIGAFPSGFVIENYYKKDIRQFGSGNTGATNSFSIRSSCRILGNISRYFQRGHDFLPFMVTS